MNQYGAMAQRHWGRWLPQRYGQILDPEAFFAALGEEVMQEVLALADALAGDDLPGESYLDKVGRLNMARLNAESDVLRERVLLPAESENDG